MTKKVITCFVVKEFADLKKAVASNNVEEVEKVLRPIFEPECSEEEIKKMAITFMPN